MAKVSPENQEIYFDKRTVNRYKSKGLVSEADVQNYLKSLPNDEDNFELAPFEDDLEISSEKESDEE